MEEEPAVGSHESEVLSMNALSMNALSMNALSMNALSMNALSTNALSTNALSMNALSMNALDMNALDGVVYELNARADNALVNTQEGRELLRYMARCALPAGDYLRIESSAGQSWDLPGVLGLVPHWVSEPMDVDDQELMSACLLSHVNAFGIEVPISARSAALPPAEGKETETFFYGDGTFYGNLFARSSAGFSCKIRARDYLDPATGELVQASSPNADERICAGETTAAECGMVFTGYCDEVCNVIEQDGQQWRFSDCLGADGQRYANTISVWLQGEHAESCLTAPDGFGCDPGSTF